MDQLEDSSRGAPEEKPETPVPPPLEEEAAPAKKAEPAQEGPKGIRYDFNEGCRIQLPEGPKWRVQIRDAETHTFLFDRIVDGGRFVQSAKRYYVPFEVKAWELPAESSESVSEREPDFHHLLDLAGRPVFIRMEIGGLGDHLAWIGHALAFGRRHQARLTCVVRPDIIPLLAPAHEDVRFITAEEAEKEESQAYATYKVMIFFEDHGRDWQPVDYRQAGLAVTGAYMLGLEPVPRRPEIAADPGRRPIKSPYVVIAVQGSALAKIWTNPHGWREVIRFLHGLGYRVACIDQNRFTGSGSVSNHIPHGCEDQTGDRPLSERARWLKHADFFIGLSSGLSWLAWAAGTPVVMISGFTEPYNEFATPWRIINRHACHGCANDTAIRLDLSDWFFCPRHKGTARACECSRLISPQQVTGAIRNLIQTLPARKRARLKAAARKQGDGA